MTDASPICTRCRKPVSVNAASYELFEHMHWLCFHLEFEHDGDPDIACDDVSRPWSVVEALSARLRAIGEDPRQVLDAVIKQRFSR